MLLTKQCSVKAYTNHCPCVLLPQSDCRCRCDRRTVAFSPALIFVFCILYFVFCILHFSYVRIIVLYFFFLLLYVSIIPVSPFWVCVFSCGRCLIFVFVFFFVFSSFPFAGLCFDAGDVGHEEEARRHGGQARQRRSPRHFGGETVRPPVTATKPAPLPSYAVLGFKSPPKAP